MTEPIDAEQRVEAMIAEGRKIVADAMAEHKPVAVVAAYSSGDDSIVSTHFAMSNLPGCVVFNADTLVGLAPARCHLRAVCERLRWPLEIENAVPLGKPKPIPVAEWDDSGETAFEEFVLNWGFAGRGKRQHGWMYQRLKGRPVRRLIRRLQRKKGDRVALIAGIRHDESAIRAGFHEPYRLADSSQLWINPFYHRTAADFEAYRQEFGLPRNPVKARCGISGECCCGTFANPTERAAYRVADPGFADYLDGLEARVRERFPWGWGESPPAWWVAERADARNGQRHLFGLSEGETFQPMCVGCNSGRR